MGKNISSMAEVIGHIVFLAELMMEDMMETSHFSLMSVERGIWTELSGNWQCSVIGDTEAINNCYFSNFLITAWTETETA